MKPYKVTYHVAVEHDGEATDWKRRGLWKSPVVPHAGLWVDVGDGNFREVGTVGFGTGTFRQIDDVYVWPENPGEIEIHFVAEDEGNCVRSPDLMPDDGWEPGA